MEPDNKLNVLNESGEVVGEESREKIHRDGLLHAEVHVWFYTPQGGVVFQHRAKDKDTYPDLLDATAGGHVEIGESFQEAAVKEVNEETGLTVRASDLEFIIDMKEKSFDETTGMTNNVFRKVYAYRFNGDVGDLRVEKGKAVGFELWPSETILNTTTEDKGRFIPMVFGKQAQTIFREIKRKANEAKS